MAVGGVKGGNAWGAVGAVAAQATAAGGSLVLQVLAARTLGAAGYGQFALVVAMLVLFAALQGGWVGDARIVLDRHDPLIRGALLVSQFAFMALGCILGFVGGLVLGLTDGSGAAVLGVLVGLWALEDAGRRLFIARLEYWKLMLNDVIYIVGALIGFYALRSWNDEFSVDTFAAAMAMGALAAVGAAWIQLPKSEFLSGPVTALGARQVASYGAWRSAHAGIRPLTTFVMRLLVATLVSAAALGQLEAARLVIAPLIVLLSGTGTFLLPIYVRLNRAGSPVTHRSLRMTISLLLGATAVYTTFAVILTDVMAELVSDGRIRLDRLLVGGWCAYAAGLAAGIPVGAAVLARRESRRVFRIRMLDSAIGLTCFVILLQMFGPRLAPYGLAVGAFVGAALLWAQATDVRRDSGEGGA